jgi:two-component system sensor histidine kinase QseC
MKFSEKMIAKAGSMQRFLVIVITFVFTVFMGVIYLLTAHQSEHEIDEIFDSQLAHSAFILFNLFAESVPNIDQKSAYLPIVYHGFDDPRANNAVIEDNDALNDDKHQLESFIYENKLAYQVFNEQGKLLIKSSSAPDITFSDKKQGYSNIQIADDKWRVYTLYDKDWKFWLYVAESESIRDELISDISKQIVLPALLAFPVFLGLLFAIIRFGLAPLKQLVNSINRREAYSLKPINMEVIPQELTPVLDAINAMITRLDDALTREKRLTADTAHELRTPLSVVLIHAQNALNNSNEKDRDIALVELEKGIKRVARLLEQLLTLSKISPETIPKTTIKFHQLCQNISAEMAVKIMSKQQELELICAQQDQEICLSGSEFLLEILLRNLLDNASQYSPEKGLIKLTLQQADKQAILTVEDSGNGIDSALYSRLTERFYRQYQQQGKGAGLGLTLVKNIVDFHQGRLSFGKSSLGGLQVKVIVPVSCCEPDICCKKE